MYFLKRLPDGSYALNKQGRQLINQFTIKAPTKLQKAIMAEYYARFSATSSVHERTYIGTSTVLKRTKP